jgi:transcriptional regulator with XRE-family HTH domain
MAKVTARHIWRLEAGKRPNVAAVTLSRIALAVDVDINYLVGLTDVPQLEE